MVFRGLGVGLMACVGRAVGVGVAVGCCVGWDVDEGCWVAAGLLLMTAAWPVVGVGDGCDARFLLPMAEPIQEKKRSTAMSAPHPRDTFIPGVLVLYHCQILRWLLLGGSGAIFVLEDC